MYYNERKEVYCSKGIGRIHKNEIYNILLKEHEREGFKYIQEFIGNYIATKKDGAPIEIENDQLLDILRHIKKCLLSFGVVSTDFKKSLIALLFVLQKYQSVVIETLECFIIALCFDKNKILSVELFHLLHLYGFNVLSNEFIFAIWVFMNVKALKNLGTNLIHFKELIKYLMSHGVKIDDITVSTSKGFACVNSKEYDDLLNTVALQNMISFIVNIPPGHNSIKNPWFRSCECAEIFKYIRDKPTPDDPDYYRVKVCGICCGKGMIYKAETEYYKTVTLFTLIKNKLI